MQRATWVSSAVVSTGLLAALALCGCGGSSATPTSPGAGSSCTAGGTCTPANPCHSGTISCATGGPVCVETGANVPNGTACGQGSVCGGGVCTACVAGQACTPANACHTGAIACGTGSPVCVDSGTSLLDGTSCGQDMVCGGGVCTACVSGQACVPAVRCREGTIACGTGRPVCVDTGVLRPDGSYCSDVAVCTAGVCGRSFEGFEGTVSMNDGRSQMTATLLPSGKVLIAGGSGGGGVLASAELYDPATRIFTRTGSMVVGRSLHTATLLQNGKVLVTGGFTYTGGINSLNSAELYDPATGVFSPTGSMLDSRFWHTATLLPGGKVLVASGQSSVAGLQGDVAGAELYDPDTGLFTATGPMLPPGSSGATRIDFTATLLPSGKVLVAGGAQLTSSGPPPGDALWIRAQLYDPGTGLFSPTGKMTIERQSHTATLLPDGRVLLTGGGSSSAELFDPAAGLFTATGSMSVARSSHTATLLPTGKVLVTGGAPDVSSAEIYDPATGQFTPTGAMATWRGHHTATLLPGGEVLVAGGVTAFDAFHVCADLRDAELWVDGPVRLLFSSPSVYGCQDGFQAAIGISNGSTSPVEVYVPVWLDVTAPKVCPGTIPVMGYDYTAALSTVAPGTSATILSLLGSPYCCPAPGCTASSVYGDRYDVYVPTSAGVMKATVSAVVDLRGCSVVCP